MSNQCRNTITYSSCKYKSTASSVDNPCPRLLVPEVHSVAPHKLHATVARPFVSATCSISILGHLEQASCRSLHPPRQRCNKRRRHAAIADQQFSHLLSAVILNFTVSRQHPTPHDAPAFRHVRPRGPARHGADSMGWLLHQKLACPPGRCQEF